MAEYIPLYIWNTHISLSISLLLGTFKLLHVHFSAANAVVSTLEVHRLFTLWFSLGMRPGWDAGSVMVLFLVLKDPLLLYFHMTMPIYIPIILVFLRKGVLLHTHFSIVFAQLFG